ncbi:heavy metal-associated domain-containing protein [Arthrobacter sp. 24S4-2]|uniref:heavy-metal-associated domain-containing protein n=1 Tax=Arthrobacter sp. 24S4-2 TaxID=2575374 RepID=UPI0020C83112|nr:heavy metal-associated domain-containing protein [Arthrobacter sp. 24S4-2]
MSNEHLLNRPGSRVIELDIEGMTCASCVNRVERKLGKLDGVQASVNLPLESAHVTAPAGITDEQITATVEAAGYKARVRPPLYPSPTIGSGEPPTSGDAGGVRQHASREERPSMQSMSPVTPVTLRPVITWPTVAPQPSWRRGSSPRPF